MADHDLPPQLNALVFMSGRDCARYVARAVETVGRQTHTGLHVLFVDDASQDDTADVARQALAEHLPGRHTVVVNPERWGKARNAEEHLKPLVDQHDFVAVLDADDALIDPEIISLMAVAYAGGSDVVWSNYRISTGGRGHCGPLDPRRSAREQPWASSHFFSFRAELLTSVPREYFQDEAGAWLTSACDWAIAYPVLDQTRRWTFVDREAYLYNAGNPASHHNRNADAPGLTSVAQEANGQVVKAKRALPCTRPAVQALPAPRVPARRAERWQPPAAPPPSSTQVELPRDPREDERWERIERKLDALLALAGSSGPAGAPAQQPPSRPATVLPRQRRGGREGASWGEVPSMLVSAGSRVLQFGEGPSCTALRHELAAQGAEVCIVEVGPAAGDAVLRGDHRVQAPLRSMEVAGWTGAFPDVTAGPVSGVDVVVVGAADEIGPGVDRTLALPVVAGLVGGSGLTLVLLDAFTEEGRGVLHAWRALVPDLRVALQDADAGWVVLSAGRHPADADDPATETAAAGV